MAMFKGFKPQAMNKIAGAMGYQGDMNQFQQYVDQDPARQQQMNMYTNAARKMAAGGYVPRFNTGGLLGNIGNTGNMLGNVVGSSVGILGQAPAQQPAGPIASSGTLPNISASEMPDLPMPQPDPELPEQPDPQPQPPSNRGVVTNPAGTQAGTPTFTGASDSTVYDAFAPFRQNVEVYSETGAFKNPNLQSSHDTMLEVLAKEEEADNPLAPVKQEKTNAIVDYLRNIYTGPIYTA